MLPTDAQVTHHPSQAVAARPDQAVLPVVLTVDASTASEGVQAARTLAHAIHRGLSNRPVQVRPRRMAGERQKLLKKGVFGQGVRVHSRYELDVTLALDDSWDFWQRLEHVEAVRAALHEIADGDGRMSVGAPSYELVDRDQAGREAIATLHRALDEWQSATGLTLTELARPEIVVRVEGPDRAWVEATATATFTPTR